MIKSIGIDLDGVLNNMHEEWINRYNKDYDDNLTIDDIKGWGIQEYVKPECGDKMLDYVFQEGFFNSLKPQKHSVEVTRELMKHYEVYIVTATHPEQFEEKYKWLQRYFAHIPLDRIVVAQDKTVVNVDLLIDDAAHNITTFPNKVLVYDYEWNRHLKSYERVYGWKDIADKLLGDIK